MDKPLSTDIAQCREEMRIPALTSILRIPPLFPSLLPGHLWNMLCSTGWYGAVDGMLASLIPIQGTYLGCGQFPSWRHARGNQ